jgi:hypothetical protein
VSFAEDAATAHVDAQFDLWGAAATYTPPGGGAGVPCVVIVGKPDQVYDTGGLQLVRSATVVRVRSRDLPSPAENGVFTVGSSVHRVLGQPLRGGPANLVWTAAAT